MRIVTTRAFEMAALAGASALAPTTPGPLNAAKVALYTTLVVPSRDTPLDAYILATFTGSAPKTVTWAGPFLGALNQPTLFATTAFFDATAPVVVPETVFGFIITNTAGTVVYAAAVLDEPVAVDEEGDVVVVEIELPYGA